MARSALRVGWLAKGLLFTVIGVLAVEIARRRPPGEDADQTGALAAIAEVTAGRALVFVVAGGLLAYAAWNVWSAASSDHDGWIELATRLGRVGLAIVYALLAETALQIALDGGPPPSTSDGPTTPAGIAQRLFEVPVGRFLVVALGLGTLSVAGYQLWRAVTGDFLADISTDDLGDRARHGLRGLGTAGFVARAGILAVAGWLFVDAARRQDPERAAGLDDALRTLREAPGGPLVMAAMGVGLVAAGVYDAVTFRRQKVEG